MNKERILEIADRVEAEGDVKLDMAKYVSGCGTTACIAGFAALMFAGYDFNKNHPGTYNFEGIARSKLDVSLYDGDELFHARSMDGKNRDPLNTFAAIVYLAREYTSKQLADALRQMTKTGKVNWHMALIETGAYQLA